MLSRAIGSSKVAMPVFWHGTKAKLVPKILKEGLRSAYEGTGFNSTFLPKGKYLREVSIEAMKGLPAAIQKASAKHIEAGIQEMEKWKPGVSLSRNRREALVYAAMGSPTKAHSGLLKVRIPKSHARLKQWSGQTGREGQDEWRFTGDIPADWIEAEKSKHA